MRKKKKMKNNYQIGDWVYDSARTKYPMQVVAVFGERNGNICDLDLDFEDNEGDVYQRKADEVEPIPITAEILRKNGFNLVTFYNGFVCRWGDIDKKHISWSDCYTVIDGYDSERVFKGYTIYVNELQQALRLCGIDKEIKL